jgi:rhamnulokinase/L-fuculokinase
VPVVAVASHDTASAVMAVPATEEKFIFISCGTWSLFGTECAEPVINEHSKTCNLTNELGFGASVTFLKNIIGLWLIQETRRQFIREGREYTYAQMEEMARKSRPFTCFIDPDAPEFVPIGDIPGRVREFCKKTGQTIPASDGEIIRCIYESLTMKYRFAFEQIKSCTNESYKAIHIVGGGTKDSFLCQMTADAANLPVIAGPIEATAMGNATAQLVALGQLSNLEQARFVIRNSFKPLEYLPTEPEVWSQQYLKIQRIFR